MTFDTLFAATLGTALIIFMLLAAVLYPPTRLFRPRCGACMNDSIPMPKNPEDRPLAYVSEQFGLNRKQRRALEKYAAVTAEGLRTNVPFRR